MPSANGSVYGLTLLCPILNDPAAVPSHDLQIRAHLAQLSAGADSPFAIAPGTHLARLVVLDDVIYVGAPSCEEHLKSKYLIFESNCDGGRDSYLTGLAKAIPQELDTIWNHCAGYPEGGAANLSAFLAYMKRCELDTTFFFAPVNDKTRTDTLVALRNKAYIANFISQHQGKPAVEIQQKMLALFAHLKSLPDPQPAAVHVARRVATGGRNE
ncbi:MAG TPA: hypothetical protein VGN16_25150 [Acidobacteriaceae bacterium]|jgi:hypothetical protein